MTSFLRWKTNSLIGLNPITPCADYAQLLKTLSIVSNFCSLFLQQSYNEGEKETAQFMKKLEVGILGATGMVGQRFVSLLENHPWFEVAWLGASEKSAGRNYAEACNWRLRDPIPERARPLQVHACEPGAQAGKIPQLMFASLDSKVSGEVEKAFAHAGHVVVSNSGTH